MNAATHAHRETSVVALLEIGSDATSQVTMKYEVIAPTSTSNKDMTMDTRIVTLPN